MGRLMAETLHLVLAGFQLEFQIIQLAQHCIQTLVVRRQMLLGGLDDPLRNAQFFADEERVGFAGHADAQLIGGPQRFQVKLTAGIDHAGGLQRKDFQLRIVGGGHQQDTPAAQFFDDGHSQGGAFRRVGAGAQLIQKHQSAGTGQFQNAGDFGHVTREGGQALLDALFVADVHQILLEHTDFAAFVCRDQEAALGHGAQQAGRLEGNSLAAGIWTSDDERVIILPQRDVDRHALGRVDQRVPSPNQRERALIADRGLEGLHLNGHPCLGKQDVDFQHGFVAVLELRLNGGHLAGKGRQNPLDFLGFLGAVLQNAGIGFHDGLGLHKDGGAGGGNVVDDAADFAAVLALDRDDIAPVADGNHGLL